MKDIFKEMEELRAKLDELSAYAEKECKKSKMFPQEGETYWYILLGGNILSTDACDSKGRFNVFRTKEEAEKARDIQCAKQRVSHAIEVENDGWLPNFKNNGQYNYHFYLSDNIAIDYHRTVKEQPKWMYMKSDEVASKILAEYEADLLLILGA